jgi:PHD/YefM family antitoxin component YafN of YafNO toxin-antitoxin module
VGRGNGSAQAAVDGITQRCLTPKKGLPRKYFLSSPFFIDSTYFRIEGDPHESAREPVIFALLTLYYYIYYNIYNCKEKYMLIEARQMVPITRLQKELAQTVRELSDSGNPVYILKNNNMEAVLLSYDEYEYLKSIETVFEQSEIKNMIDKRLKKYNPRENISWENLKERI